MGESAHRTERATTIVRAELRDGPLPYGDGWSWFYRFHEETIKPRRRLRDLVCGHFWPRRFEGPIYRLLGVNLFGKVIPTGGIAVRRALRVRMTPYTLKGTSAGAARAFFYRACIFELLHTPFLLTLLGISVHRFLIGRADLALEDLFVNLLFNIYPILHHRNTRVRIVRLLERRARRGVTTVSRSDPGDRR